MVAWDQVCLLKENGSLGIINIFTQNEALLTKWIWKLESEGMGYWAVTLCALYGIDRVDQLHTHAPASFFLKTLVPLVPFFKCSVRKESQSDTLLWSWTAIGLFTTKSAYEVLPHRNSVCLLAKYLET